MIINTSSSNLSSHATDQTSLSLDFQIISNSNFLMISIMSLYMLTVGYYLLLLTEWFINKLVAQRQFSLQIVDDNSPSTRQQFIQTTNHEESSNNNNSVNTTNNIESLQAIPTTVITTSEETSSETTTLENHQTENTNSNQDNNDQSTYIHPDLSPSSVCSESIFTSTTTESVQADSLLTIFKELVQKVIDTEKEWTRIISSQLESRLSYYDSSDSSSSYSSSDDYIDGKTNYQNVRMRRTSPTLKRMHSFQFPRAINFAL